MPKNNMIVIGKVSPAEYQPVWEALIKGQDDHQFELAIISLEDAQELAQHDREYFLKNGRTPVASLSVPEVKAYYSRLLEQLFYIRSDEAIVTVLYDLDHTLQINRCSATCGTEPWDEQCPQMAISFAFQILCKGLVLNVSTGPDGPVYEGTRYTNGVPRLVELDFSSTVPQ